MNTRLEICSRNFMSIKKKVFASYMEILSQNFQNVEENQENSENVSKLKFKCCISLKFHFFKFVFIKYILLSIK